MGATSATRHILTDWDVSQLKSYQMTLEAREDSAAHYRKIRNQHIAKCVDLGMPVARVAEQLNISPRAVYKILDQQGRTS